MKTVYKIVYYDTIVFSTFILCLFLFAPGGLMGIFKLTKLGFYFNLSGGSLFLLRLGQVFAGLFFLTCALSVLLPLARFQQQSKHKIAFVFFLILSSIVLITWVIKLLN